MQVEAIFGPTASGKSALAFARAQKTGWPILNTDSRQMYQEMDIVTGKDLPEPGVKLFGIDIILPNQSISIADFYKCAQENLAKITNNSDGIILVGGSWQYLSVLWDPPESLFSPPSLQRAQRENWSLEQWQEAAQNAHPDRFLELNNSDRHNPRRLQRLLEISENPNHNLPAPLFQRQNVALTIINPPLAVVRENIANRIEERINTGALAETASLIAKYSWDSSSAFTATGYFELRDYLENKISLEEAKKRWFQREWDYARRQYTWIRKITA